MRVSALLLASLFCYGHALRGSPDIRSFHFGLPGALVADEQEEVATAYLCPATGMDHFPNVTRCDGYYLCLEGVGSHQLCPEGMLYNSNAPSNTYPCEDAANVTCDLPPIVCPPPGPPGPPGPQGPPGTGGQQEPPGPPSVCPMPPSVRPIPPLPPTLMPPAPSPPPVCPDSFTRHLPAHGSCSSFYECRGGVAERQECPSDLLYNAASPPTRFPCDYFYNVVCGVSLAPPSGFFFQQQQQKQQKQGDRELDQPKKIFNFYTYVTNKW
ncbi:uncharacterized protein LOC135091465 isoform X2 [Scylla paramamosain]|uniref:uncharacterized protein LOC135091465 isoform X2 n=1 Tax=Scylla paramamosain TaxID=85552 RepID=UPI003082A7FA